MWVLDPDGDPRPLYRPDDWPEDSHTRVLSGIRRVEIDEMAREQQRIDIEFSRLPVWLQAIKEGDQLSDGSDQQEYDDER